MDPYNLHLELLRQIEALELMGKKPTRIRLGKRAGETLLAHMGLGFKSYTFNSVLGLTVVEAENPDELEVCS